MLTSPTLVATPRRASIPEDVKYVGAVNGCYALSDRRNEESGAVEVYACRLCSISPQQAVIVAPIIAAPGETVVAHFKEFGILRSQVVREMPAGFVISFDLDDAGRKKLAAKIHWKKQQAISQVPDKREHPRIMPRHPRSVLTLADGSRQPCFVIDVSQSGAAISAAILPGKGTPVAVGSMVGRVVRRLDLGFAVEFTTLYPADELEERLKMPPR